MNNKVIEKLLVFSILFLRIIVSNNMHGKPPQEGILNTMFTDEDMNGMSLAESFSRRGMNWRRL
jgi:hypothetical protein